jgi:hypothetical protein
MKRGVPDISILWSGTLCIRRMYSQHRRMHRMSGDPMSTSTSSLLHYLFTKKLNGKSVKTGSRDAPTKGTAFYCAIFVAERLES